LFSILERLKPNVILFEHPISWSTDKFSEKAKKFSNENLEGLTALKYLEENPSVLLKYFDIANRNKYYKETNYFEHERKFSEQLFKLKENNKLSSLAESRLEQISIVLKIRNVIEKSNPRLINSVTSDSVISLKQKYVRNNIIKLTKMIPELHKFNKYANDSKHFWDKRSRKMVENITKYSRDFQGKRLIVLTGFEHRYDLRKLLQERGKPNYILKEYWELIDKE